MINESTIMKLIKIGFGSLNLNEYIFNIREKNHSYIRPISINLRFSLWKMILEYGIIFSFTNKLFSIKTTSVLVKRA